MLILPSYIGASNTSNLLNFANQVLHYNDETIDCDASRLEFVDPLALCMLASVCHDVSSSGREVNIHNLADNMNSYMGRMDFFENCNIENRIVNLRHDRRDSLVEIHRIEHPSQVSHLSLQIASAIVGQTPEKSCSSIPDEMTGYTEADRLEIPLQYIFSELLENSLTHGKRAGFHQANVWVAAQYYPKKDLIRLSIVDNGCGYFSTLQNHPQLISRSHQGAISTALLADISCNNDLNLIGDSINQGIGLTVVKDLALAGAGLITIISGDTTLIKKTESERFIDHENWQGSMVFIQLSRENLKTLNIHNVISHYQPTVTEDTPFINFE